MTKSKILKTSIFGVIILLVLYWGVNFLNGKNLLSKTNVFYVEYSQINGLQKNSYIYLRGYHIGQVTDIKFSSSKYNSLIVELSITSDVQIPKGTTAKIFSADLMGTKAIELIYPEKFTEFVANNATLNADITESLGDQVKAEMAPLKMHIEKLMQSATIAIEQFKYIINENTGENINNSLLKTQKAIDAFYEAAINVNSILSNNSDNIQSIFTDAKSVMKTIEGNKKDIDRILTNISKTTDTLSQANIGELIRNADKTIKSIQVITDKINNNEGTLQSLISNKDLYNNLETTTQNLNLLILDVKKQPKKYVSFPIIQFNKKDEKSEEKNDKKPNKSDN